MFKWLIADSFLIICRLIIYLIVFPRLSRIISQNNKWDFSWIGQSTVITDTHILPCIWGILTWLLISHFKSWIREIVRNVRNMAEKCHSFRLRVLEAKCFVASPRALLLISVEIIYLLTSLAQFHSSFFLFLLFFCLILSLELLIQYPVDLIQDCPPK